MVILTGLSVLCDGHMVKTSRDNGHTETFQCERVRPLCMLSVDIRFCSSPTRLELVWPFPRCRSSSTSSHRLCVESRDSRAERCCPHHCHHHRSLTTFSSVLPLSHLLFAAPLYSYPLPSATSCFLPCPRPLRLRHEQKQHS